MIMQKTDTDIKRLMQERLPQAPKSEWFTRKVMNRLPGKRRQTYSWIEYISYAIALIIYIGAWIPLLDGIRTSDAVTMNDLISAVTLAGIGLGMALGFMLPQIRRWIRYL